MAGTAAATAFQSPGVRSSAARGMTSCSSGRYVLPVIAEVGGRGRFHVRTRLQCARDHRIQMRQGAVSPATAITRCSCASRSVCGFIFGIPFAQAREHQIFLGMMKLIRVMPQVIDDVPHQVIVRLLTRVERGDLLLQKVEQPCEIEVLSAPNSDQISHTMLLSIDRNSRHNLEAAAGRRMAAARSTTRAAPSGGPFAASRRS